MNDFIKKVREMKYANERVRFLTFVFFLFLILLLARYLLAMAYSRYEIRAKINSDIDKALYIFTDETTSFNLEPLGIIPSDDPYVYRFSVSNYNSSKQSDVDMSYKVKIRTTTNLPIGVKLYRNEAYDSPSATNLFTGATTGRDEDNAWYRLYETNSEFEFYYENQSTDIFTLVINFPAIYANDIDYANYIENIEVILESKQII